ncbi:hypothetical protein N2152v2_010195 [Parachlorella kessleri]
MLRAVARNTARLAPRYEALVAQRGMSLAGMKGYDDRESAEEEEERNLRKLLAKLKKQAEASDAPAAAASKEAEVKALQPIIEKYKITNDDVEKILEWRHSADH